MSIRSRSIPSCSRPPLRSALRDLLTIACLLATAGLAWAQSAAGVVTHLAGTLVVKQETGPKLLAVGSAFHAGELLATQQGTYARLRFNDGSEVALRPNSQFEIRTYAFQESEPAKDNFAVSLIKGGLRMVTGALGKRSPANVNVNTVVATIGIRGTHFGLLLCQGDCADFPTVTGQPPADGLHSDVADGIIAMTTDVGEILVSPSEFGYAADRRSSPRLVKPEEGFQVTLPENISMDNAGGRSVGESRDVCLCAIK